MLELIETSIPGRRVEALQPRHPTTEDCFRNLAAAVLLQAHRDLRDPGYRNAAARWLKSPAAGDFAELVGIDRSAVGKLLGAR